MTRNVTSHVASGGLVPCSVASTILTFRLWNVVCRIAAGGTRG